jgi:hypothetical protein
MAETDRRQDLPCPASGNPYAHSLDGFVKYDILTAVHNLLIHKARDIGAGFHMMTADHIYSEAFFENLLRLGEQHDAIPHAPLNVDPGTALPLVEEFASWPDGSLRISPQAIWALARPSICMITSARRGS